MANELTEADYSNKEAEVPGSVSAAVKKWTDKIKQAKVYWRDDFDRMRENMEFAGGFQWAGQAKLDDDRYIANLALRLVNQKVAALYAKNPKFSANKRKRLYFKIWDGRVESIQQAVALSSSPEATPEDAFAAGALLADYSNGRVLKDLVDKVGQTLECLLMWYIGNQTPAFKVQMKQMVRRVITTGVGYIKLNFTRGGQGTLSTTEKDSSVAQRLAEAQEIINRIDEGKIDQQSAELVRLQALLASLQSFQGTDADVDEKLEFDFPPSTAIIVDPDCRALKGFIGAKWVVHEHFLTKEEINAQFGTNINYGTTVKEYTAEGKEALSGSDPTLEHSKECRVCLWEIFEISTRTKYHIVEGYDNFVIPPATLTPETKNFWPFFALTFNEVEVEPGKQKASIYPPSDVQLIKSAQKEWNRTRQDLRQHRTANRPKYVTGKGWLTEADIEALVAAKANSVIQLEGAQMDGDINKMIAALAPVPIDPMVYDTAPLQQDLLVSNGNEEGAQPASTKGTATAATINEQSRMVVTGSNIDDLDDFLSDVAEASGEILLREVSLQTVLRVVGDGAVWPDMGMRREDFINYIFLEVVGASSGRPNKALEISNFVQLGPILLQAGVNPQFIAREAIKRLDDRLDLDDAFALAPSAAVAMPMGAPQEASQPGPEANPPRGEVSPSAQNQHPAATEPNAEKVQKPKVTE